MARVLNPRRRRGAFSMAEVVLALGLAVVAVLSAVELGISAMNSNQKGTDLMLASGLASQTTEQFVYGLPPVTDSFWSSSQTGVYQTSDVGLGTRSFHQELFVQNCGGVGAGLKMVLVNVSWGGGSPTRAGSGLQTVQVTRLIYGH